MNCTTTLSAYPSVEDGVQRRRFRRILSPLHLATVFFLLAVSFVAGAAPAATTTALTVTSKTVNSRTITVLSAAVTNPSAVTKGLVRFYDGNTPIGSAQLVATGAKYTKGTANLSLELAPGAHSLKAVFAGTTANATSTSTAKPVTIAGGSSSTVLSATGSAGNYTLTAQVVGSSVTAPAGSVSFIDQTASNTLINKATLGTATSARKFANAVNYPIYNKTGASDFYSPEDVKTADLNLDGVLDLLVLDYEGGVSIYLGKADGTFKTAAPFCTSGTPAAPCDYAYEPVSFAVGDFNSDGVPDLAILNGDSRVSIALGKGDGTFQIPVDYDTASSPTEVRVADLDRDGVADLVVAVDGGISVLLGNGDGTFQPHNETALSDASTYISIGDFNKDGIPDVVVAGWNGSTAMVLLGNGDGTFKNEVDTTIDVNTGSCHVQAVDLKGSGYLADLAYCGGAGQVDAALGNGKGGFGTPQVLYANGTFSPFVAGLAATDINGDGAVDLLLTWYSSDSDTGRVAVFSNKNDGTGTFTATPANYYVGKHPVAITTGDFNGDGTVDIAVANQASNNVSVLLDAASQTATAVLSNISVPGTGAQSVVAQYAGDVSYAASTSAAITLTGSGVAAPVIGSISPTSVAAGSAGGTLTVNGTGFASGAQVKWNGAALTTAFVSATKLTATYTATQVASVGSVAITVLSGGQTSNAATLTITGSTAAPAITSLSPSSATAGGAAFTLTVNGTNFASGAQVKWNGSARTTTFASATKVTAAIAAADIATAGTAAVTVTVGSGTSNPVSFPIAAASAKPVPSAVTPNFAVVGSAATTVTIAGTGFASGSVVSFNVTKLATTYVSATKLTAVIPAASLTTLGTQAITVANGTAVSATSLAFTVGPAAHTPLAYGYFSAAAKVGASSGNIACTWDKTDSEYLCTVTGEHFFYQNYVVNVTLADSEALAFVSVNSMGGEQILVKFHNPEGASIQEPFYITVFKP